VSVSREARAPRYRRVVRHQSSGRADVSSGSVERSDIGDSNNRAGPREVDLRPHTSN